MKRLLGLVVVIAALTACGSDGNANSPGATVQAKASSSSVADQASAPMCASLPADPAWAAKLDASGGCTIGGTLQVASSFDCRDGSKVYSFGPGSEYWGNSKDKALSVEAAGKDTAADPAYGAAYKKCQTG